MYHIIRVHNHRSLNIPNICQLNTINDCSLEDRKKTVDCPFSLPIMRIG